MILNEWRSFVNFFFLERAVLTDVTGLASLVRAYHTLISFVGLSWRFDGRGGRAQLMEYESRNIRRID
uniref:Uncharacterized protein n=1 Tax=Physcomitrium patens TaxID=3218 RepID=A0A7I3ZFK3_PHYPA